MAQRAAEDEAALHARVALGTCHGLGVGLSRRRVGECLARLLADLRLLSAITQMPPHHLLGLSSNLQAEAQLSVVEYTVLDALSRQDGWHMRMQQLAREFNREGARLARAACDAAEARDPSHPRFVVGVLGR